MTQQQDRAGPKTDEEHAIHALNIQGTFFERKCQSIVNQSKDWQIQDTNYPVTYGGQNSNLDIWAQLKTGTGTHLMLSIECKKNNPGFIDWVFFRQPEHRPKSSQLQIIQINRTPPWWLAFFELHHLVHDMNIADEAWETKGDYQKIKNQQDRTRTSNKAITEAATQIAIATQALMKQEYSGLEEISNRNRINTIDQQISKPYHQLFVFPTIVTTANLFTCEFKESDVDLSTGEIDFSKAQLVPSPFLIYDYPVPPALQLTPSALHLDYTRDTLKQLARMPIIIVQSEAFPTFLERLTLPEPHKGPFSDNGWYELQLQPDNIGQ